ncbi:peptidoglycan-binding protein [Mastigocoleus sp. MO_188.B34]|uniref:peptidoglycan-binding domain-containing protein n=1 Tax=Mastigocoleus sp. MO_188.B34 TaxID=3036635 RepID=UPI00261F53C1|nr:peptidoglycan-binding protein [Mastigocoleus sp. MO_188.B34]MDJ0696375.1 peptidoglycan-binding protein [Mastigocoleus sp. MO_188.B34]
MKNINKVQFNLSDREPEFGQHIPAGVDLKLLTESKWVRLANNPVKSVLLVAIALLFVGTTTQTASAQQRGQRGPQVSYVQRCLKRLGYFNARVTGFYGSATEAAVTRFQAAVGLQQVGKVGPRTTRALNRRCGSGNNTRRGGGLRRGSSGPAVTRLQRNLKRLGYYDGPITGRFLNLTDAAVRRFQGDNGISAIGVVGPRTNAAIRRGLNSRVPERQTPVRRSNGRYCDPNFEALYVGCNGEWVRELQANLQSLRFYNGSVDGSFGSRTERAVMEYQRSRGLPENGIADLNTLSTIRTEMERLGVTYPPPEQGIISERDSNWSTGGSEVLLREGDRGRKVTRLQERLQELGFFRRSETTDYFGPATREAVAAYQRFYGLPITGYVDRETSKKLGLDRRGDRRYVVVVPVNGRDILWRVRQFVPNAFAARSPRGDYVNAGEFEDLSQAREVSKELRERGLDARVEYL